MYSKSPTPRNNRMKQNTLSHQTPQKVVHSNLPYLGLIPILSTIAASVAIYFLASFLPKKLPLFYSLPWGEGQLVTLSQFLIIPALVSALALFNLLVFWQLKSSQNFLKQILIYSTLLSTAVLMLSFIKIILIFL